jgi:hypothetical protein
MIRVPSREWYTFFHAVVLLIASVGVNVMAAPQRYDHALPNNGEMLISFFFSCSLISLSTSVTASPKFVQAMPKRCFISPIISSLLRQGSLSRKNLIISPILSRPIHHPAIPTASY